MSQAKNKKVLTEEQKRPLPRRDRNLFLREK